MSELGRIVGQQVADWVAANQKAIERRALLVGQLVLWAGRYKSNQVYAFNDMVMFRSYIALAMEDSPRGLPRPGGAGWRIVANLATGGVDNFPDVAAETALALNTPVEVVTSAISRWAMKQIEDAVVGVPGLVRWRGWWSSGEVYQDRDLVLYNRSVWLNAGGDGVPSRNGWQWLLSSQSGNAGGAGDVPPPAAVLALYMLAPDAGGIMQGLLVGGGPFVADHVSTIYAQDEETGYYHPFGANRPVWHGGRYVQNHCIYPLDFSSWRKWRGGTGTDPVITPGLADPVGGTDAYRLQADRGATDATSSFCLINQVYDANTPTDVIITIWVKSNTGDDQTFVGYDLGHVQNDGAEYTATTDWQRFKIKTGSATGEISFFIGLRGGTSTAISGGEQTLDVLIYGAQYENADGIVDKQTPSEFVEDFEVFAHANGNSVADDVVTEAKGTPYAEAPRVQDNPSATNAIEYSRDLTNAAWLKGQAVCTYDQIGLDGQLNAASVLGDDSSTGTNTVFVTVVASVNSGESNCIVAWLKKKQLGWAAIRSHDFDTGEYSFFDLENGVLGATQQGDDSDIVDVGGGWYKCIHEFTTTTDLNGAVRVYVAEADNDEVVDLDGTSDIIVGNIELHKGKTIAEVRDLPPIFTEGTPVSIDETIYSADGANHSQINYGYSFYWTPTYNTAEVTGKQELLSLVDGANLSYYDGDAGQVESTDGVNTISAVQTVVPGTTYQISIAIGEAGDNQLALAVDDGPWNEGPYDGAFEVGTLLQLFRNHGYVGYMHDLQGWDGDYDAVKQKLDELRGVA